MTLEQSDLLERARRRAQDGALSRKTETAYVNHIGRFLAFYAGADLSVERADKIGVFLEHLQCAGKLGASALNQARCALLFFYREVLEQELSPRFDRIKRAPTPEKPMVVFTAAEAKTVLANMRGAARLVASLMYGSIESSSR